MIAHISFYKEIERDNWKNGLYGNRYVTFNEKITVDFTDTNDLKEKLADYLFGLMDVKKETFIEYVENNYENDCFEYGQSEDDEGIFTHITEDNPEGWYAQYTFFVNKVTQKIPNYKF